MPKTNRPDVWTICLPMLIPMIGCRQPTDERLIELGERANARQQAQNEVIARQSEKTAELSEGFIDAEAEARQELLQLQQQLVDADADARSDLQAMHEQIVQQGADGRRKLDALHRETHAAHAARAQAIDRQRDLLEQERREIAAERLRAPIVAEAVKFAGGLIVCALPLVVVIYLLRNLRSNDDTDAAVVEAFVEELVAERPRLLPAAAPPALSGPEGDAEAPAT